MAGLEYWYEKETGTLSYLLWCKTTKAAAIIDSLMDFDIRHGTGTFQSADKILAKVHELGVDVQYILETHVHADHLTASKYLKEKLTKPDGRAPPICIGTNVVQVLKYWVPVFNTGVDTPTDGKQFDKLFNEGDEFHIGKLKVQVIYTPGHTPACIAYVLPEAKMAFVGDTIFNPSMGNARADFPGGSAKTLFASARRLLSMPEDTVLYVGHDYPDEGNAPTLGVTVKEHKEKNCTLNDRVTEAEFVAANSEKLPVPRLILPSLQVNLRAGSFGNPESNGKQYIKIPINSVSDYGR